MTALARQGDSPAAAFFVVELIDSEAITARPSAGTTAWEPAVLRYFLRYFNAETQRILLSGSAPLRCSVAPECPATQI